MKKSEFPILRPCRDTHAVADPTGATLVTIPAWVPDDKAKEISERIAYCVNAFASVPKSELEQFVDEAAEFIRKQQTEANRDRALNGKWRPSLKSPGAIVRGCEPTSEHFHEGYDGELMAESVPTYLYAAISAVPQMMHLVRVLHRRLQDGKLTIQDPGIDWKAWIKEVYEAAYPEEKP